jgi:hypothetical protein
MLSDSGPEDDPPAEPGIGSVQNDNFVDPDDFDPRGGKVQSLGQDHSISDWLDADWEGKE